MAADLEKLGEQFADQYPEMAGLLRVNAVVARKLGAPESFGSEILFTDECQRQKMVLAGKYAKKLGMSEAVYITTLPDFPQKPDNYVGLGLNIPMIVETRLSWLEMAETSGIYVSDYLRGEADNNKVTDWKEDRFEMPKMPFSVWAQDGSKFVYRKPNDIRGELLKEGKYRNYRAGRIVDAIAIANVRPDLAETMFWDVIGARVGSGRVPYLGRWHGSLGLVAAGAGNVYPSCRVLVLGKEIRTLNLAS